MTSPQQIVVGFDFSPDARPALLEALTLASQQPARVLHVLCVLTSRVAIPGVAEPAQLDSAYAELAQQALKLEIETLLATAGVTRLHFFVYARLGDPAEEILALALEVGADRIVIGGARHDGAPHVELGAVAKRVLCDAGCIVEVARPKAYQQVDLMKIVDAPAHAKYVPPHRYSYEENRMEMRPRDWPLY